MEDPVGDDLARELPRLPPTAADKAHETFRLRPGFRIDLVASEPDVVDPVAAAFDEHGRLYVAEMRDYPFTLDADNLTRSDLARRQPCGRVRRLEDADGDGRMDRSTVFLDELRWPTAVACSEGGVYVAAAPEILFASDRDGDGRAEERRVVFDGFGRRNVQALVNGLKWGIDHRLYGLNGGNGAEVRDLAHSARPPLALHSRDFRFQPGGPLEVEAASGGQFGVAFDDWGNRFACSNSDHARHVVVPGRYLDRNPELASSATSTSIAADGAAAPVFRASPPEPWRVVRTRWRKGSAEASRFAATELVPAGYFTSATGILVFRAGGLGEDCRGDLFIGDVGGNLVHRKRLVPAGATFRAQRPPEEREETASEFLTSTDNWFRPVFLLEGPDEALYVLDMYRECIEHPFSIPERIKAHLDLTSGNDRGRIWRVRAVDFAPPLAHEAPRPPGELAGDALVAALDSTNPWRRETAARLLREQRRPYESATLVLSLSSGRLSSPQARAAALWTLDALGFLESADLRRAFCDEHAEVRRNAARLAEPRLSADPQLLDALCDLAGDADPRVRFQTALSLGAAGGPQVVRALGRIALRDGHDPWFHTALLSSASRSALALFLAQIEDSDATSSPGGRSLARSLVELAAAREEPTELERLLTAVFHAADRSPPLGFSLLAGAAQGLRRKGTSLAALFANAGSGETVSALLPLRGRLAQLLEQAAGLARDESASDTERSTAAELLCEAPEPLALEALGDLLTARTPRAVQLESIRAASRRPGLAPAKLLAGAFERLSPPLRREAMEALLSRPERVEVVLDAIEAGKVSPHDLDPARRNQILRSPEQGLRERARTLLSTPSTPRREVIEHFRGVLTVPGSAERGRQAYRKACATCHRLAGEGHAVGPDLETLSGRDKESLLVQLLDPNREVDPRYVAYEAVLKDGRVASGIVASESDASVTLRRAEGVEESVLRREIVQLRSTGLSLMPEDVEKSLSAEDIADLLELLRGRGEARR